MHRYSFKKLTVVANNKNPEPDIRLGDASLNADKIKIKECCEKG